jgi:hypothetical protein
MYNENKSNWYFNAISLKEFSRTELFILFPTPVVTFSTLILLDGGKNRPAVNHETFLKIILLMILFTILSMIIITFFVKHIGSP